MSVSSLRHSSPISVLRASASASLALAFFFTRVAACGETLVCCGVAFVLDLVALNAAGSV